MPEKMYTVQLVTKDEGEINHPNPDHQLVLWRTKQGLGRTHALAYCQGCQESWRFPVREIEFLRDIAVQHLGYVHIDDLIAGRACIDSDLSDGGEEYLRKRILGFVRPKKLPEGLNIRPAAVA